MAKQFWNEENTTGSLAVLRSLVGKIDFVLIGGWAVNYYTGLQRSLDVDIAIDYGALEFFKEFGISQYEGMSIKYSVINSIYVDLFLRGFADKDLPVPIETIFEKYVLLDNIKVVEKELLLILKAWGYFRADTQKHRKDIIDVLSLLLFTEIDFSKVKEYIKAYKIDKRRSLDVFLEYLDKGEAFLDYLNMDKGEYLKRRDEIKGRIREIYTD